MAALPVGRILPSIVPSVLEGRDQWLDSAEILVVAAPFIRQQRMDGMMEVIAPLRVKPITAVGPVEEQTRVVKIAFCNELNRPVSHEASAWSCLPGWQKSCTEEEEMFLQDLLLLRNDWN